MVRMVKLASIVVIVLIFIACSPSNLILTGNIEANTKITYEGKFDEILDVVAPNAKYALLIGTDGTAVLLTSQSFSNIYIQKNNSVWDSKATNLPAVCNIRNLKEICIYSRIPNNNNNFADRLNNFEFLGQSSKNGYYIRKYKERSGDQF